MIAVAAIILVLSFVVALLAVVCLIAPIEALKMGTRKRALAGLGIAFGMFCGSILIAAAAEPPPANKAQATAAGTPKVPQVDPKVELTAETKKLWTDLLAIDETCSEASNAVAKAAKRSRDVYAMYEVTTRAENICQEAYVKMGDLTPPPSSKGEVRTAFKEAIYACREADQTKSIAYSQMAKVFDGDMRPSAVSQAKAFKEQADLGGMRCAVAFIQAAGKADLPLDLLKTDDKKAG